MKKLKLFDLSIALSLFAMIFVNTATNDIAFRSMENYTVYTDMSAEVEDQNKPYNDQQILKYWGFAPPYGVYEVKPALRGNKGRHAIMKIQYSEDPTCEGLHIQHENKLFKELNEQLPKTRVSSLKHGFVHYYTFIPHITLKMSEDDPHPTENYNALFLGKAENNLTDFTVLAQIESKEINDSLRRIVRKEINHMFHRLIELIRLMFGKKIFSNCVTPAKIGYARYYENDGLKYRLFYTDLSMGTRLESNHPRYYLREKEHHGLFPVFTHDDLCGTLDLPSMKGGERTIRNEIVQMILTLLTSVAESPLYINSTKTLMNDPDISAQIMATCEIVRIHDLLAVNLVGGDFDAIFDYYRLNYPNQWDYAGMEDLIATNVFEHLFEEDAIDALKKADNALFHQKKIEKAKLKKKQINL